jgi:hypothetical protein
MWGVMVRDLQRRAAALLREHHEDFFDTPTRKDTPSLMNNYNPTDVPSKEEKGKKT